MKGYILATFLTLSVPTQEIALLQPMTFLDVAQTTGVSIEELEKLNYYSPKDKMTSNYIRFPNRHVHFVQSGEQLSNILERYHMTEKKFKKYNPRFHTLQANQWLALSSKGLALLFEPLPHTSFKTARHSLHANHHRPQLFQNKKRTSPEKPDKLMRNFTRKDNLIQQTSSSFSTTIIQPLITHSKEQYTLKNLYTKGQCTFYAFQRRLELNLPILNGWGDAKYWGEKAKQQGLMVNSTPHPGAILVAKEGLYGHVAIVEKVFQEYIVISEMNWIAPNVINQRVINDYHRYEYIH